jgi:hypothetical protein
MQVIHIHHEAKSTRYPSFDVGNGCDLIYILPFRFNNIPELIALQSTDGDLEEFLWYELEGDNCVMSGHTGFVCVGADVHDHLSHN